MEIRVHLPRPLLTLGIAVIAVLWLSGILSIHLPGQKAALDSEGGAHPAVVINEARQDIDRERVKQAVLDRREEILRYNLEILEQQALTTKTPEDREKLAEARAVLLSVLKQRTQSEKLLMLSLQQLWDAEGTIYSTKREGGEVVLNWPVEPLLGISAHFADEAYKKRFGFPHHAIDIPTNQGTAITAPAAGTVAKVSLNGLGYSSIVLEHDGGLQTVYGHITGSTVTEGDLVTDGQIIGHTGGQPGTLGAGLTTTGPHLHFAIRKDGVLVDPLQYLPTVR